MSPKTISSKCYLRKTRTKISS